MVIKVTEKNGNVGYYAGKDKKGNIVIAGREDAKEYSPKAKGTLNQVVYLLEESGATCEYVDD